jgi:integrase
MHFIKLKKGYAVRFYDDGGKQQYLSGFKNKKEAEKAVIDFRERQLHEVDREITFAEFLDKWFEEYVLLNTCDRTKKRYQNYILKYIVPSLGHHKLSKLRASHINSFYIQKTHEDVSVYTISILHVIVYSSLKYAVSNEYIKYNPAYAVKSPRIPHAQITVFEDNELDKLLKHVKTNKIDIYIVIYIASITGMRLSEILALQMNNLDFENNRINVVWNWQKNSDRVFELCRLKTKNSKRQISLIEGTEKPIIEYIKQKKIIKMNNRLKYRENNFLITNNYGKPLIAETVSHKFKKILKDLKLSSKLCFKSLRHTHATFLLKNNVHPKIVSERLGHSSIKTTLDKYSHVIKDMQEDALKGIQILKDFLHKNF